MDAQFKLALFMMLIIALWSIRATLASGVEAPFNGISKVALTFDLGDDDIKWTLKSQDETSASYTWQDYTLNLSLEKTGMQKILHYTLTPPAGKDLSVNSYTASLSIPANDPHAVMVPNTRKIAHTLIYYHKHRTWPENPTIYRCLIPEAFEEAAHSNYEAPFILLTDSKGNNKISVGWAVADWATKLNGALEGDNYVLTLKRKEDQPFKGKKLEDALIISDASQPWMDVEEAYARTFDKYNKREPRKPAPEWTSEPVFCTWYCYDDHIDQESVMKIAHKCKELGFGTILIDAGWDAHPDGGFGDFENGVLGDFIAMPDRFPDMAGMVKQIHDMGIRVELWSGPFWEGKKSKAYQEKTKDFHMYTAEGEAHELCPKHPGTRKHYKEIFAWVAKTYGIDGMWLDAADSVPGECLAKHEHVDQPMGEAFVDCMAAIRDGLRSVNPEAITEARVLHANLSSKRALDLVQPSDAPKSYEFLRLAGIHIRPWTYDIVLKNDPMKWPDDADAAKVGKFLATMVCNGVPALSVDYLTASEEKCKQTTAWLDFYQKHKKTLLKGDFSLFGADYGIPDMMLVGDDEAAVYMRNTKTKEVTLPSSVKRIILLNCTDSDMLNISISPATGKYEMQTFNPDLSKADSITLDAENALSISNKVPQGGVAIIELK